MNQTQASEILAKYKFELLKDNSFESLEDRLDIKEILKISEAFESLFPETQNYSWSENSSHLNTPEDSIAYYLTHHLGQDYKDVEKNNKNLLSPLVIELTKKKLIRILDQTNSNSASRSKYSRLSVTGLVKLIPPEIITRSQLFTDFKTMYKELNNRGLLNDFFPAINTLPKITRYSDLPDSELKSQIPNGINSRTELSEKNKPLYSELTQRDLLDKYLPRLRKKRQK